MRLVKKIFPAFLFLFVHSVQAQNFGPSIYSRPGIGDVANVSFSRNQGMGGAGVGLSHNFQLNSLNPAALGALKYTNFEFGVAAKRNAINSTGTKQTGLIGGIQHLSLAFPIHKRFVTQFAAKPFSTVNYKDDFETQVNEKLFKTSYVGEGGLSEIYWNNAFNYKEWLMIGLNTGIILGQTTHELLQTETSRSQIATTRQRNEKHLRLSPGILITKELKSFKKAAEILPIDTSKLKDSVGLKKIIATPAVNWFVGFGATGSFFNTLSAEEELTQKTVRYESSNSSYYSYKKDTLSSASLSNYSLPNSIKVGLSLYKPNHITFALDYTLTSWSNFQYTEKTNIPINYRDQQTIAFGAEYIPDYGSTAFYKRIAYRCGLNYSNLPYVISGQNINQMQANIGAGFILPKSSGVSLNTSIAFGQRGTTDGNLAKENYWLFSVGVVANTKWFIRRKHE
jgi:hypothetical protein